MVKQKKLMYDRILRASKVTLPHLPETTAMLNLLDRLHRVDEIEVWSPTSDRRREGVGFVYGALISN